MGARDEQAAAALVSRALAWLEWLRRTGWLARLRGPDCEPVSEPAGPDGLTGLVEHRTPPECLAAERVVEAVRALRDVLERTPIAGVLAALRAAIDQLAGPSRACGPVFTGPALAAVRHVMELELLVPGGLGCPSLSTVRGHASLGAVRTTEPVEVDFETATAPRPQQEGVYDFEYRPHLRELAPALRERLVQLEVRLVGGHCMSSYLVLLSQLGDEWRVIEVVGPAQAC